MITMLNTGSKKQTIVLEKAWKYLQDYNKLETADQNLVVSHGKNTFTNLAHYFHYLPELISHDPLYLMLPSDEEEFTIDANSRTIDVPKDFRACGGVQFDNYAEIITFKIDRYFDYKDLAEAKIAVQWMNKAANKEGVSFIDLIDVKTCGDEGKLRFGWPLTAEMTEKPGELYFAVRFYTAETKDGALKFNYLLNTVTQFIEIKPTLTVDVNDLNVVKNTANVELFLNTVTRSQNPSYAIPSSVVFSDVPDPIAAIRLSDNQLELEAEAYTSDGNDIVYEWYYMAPGYRLYEPYNEDGTRGEWPEKRPLLDFYVLNSEYDPDSTDPDKKDEYIPFTQAWPVSNTNNLYVFNPIRKIYNDVSNPDFQIDTQYNPYTPTVWPTERPIGTSFWVWEDLPAPGAWRKYGWNEPWPVWAANEAEQEELGEDVVTTFNTHLHTFKSILKFKNTDAPVTGKYFVRGTNQVTDFDGETVINSVYTDAPASYCSILAPAKTKIEKEIPELFFLDSESNTLTMNLNNDEANPERFYNVYFSATQVNDISDMSKLVEESSVGEDQNTIKYTLEDEKFGYYALEAISKLNRDTTTDVSKICYVSDYPKQPDGIMNVRDADSDTDIPMVKQDLDNDGKLDRITINGFTTADWKDATNNILDIDADALGDLLVLSVKIADSYFTQYNKGDLTYTWFRSLPDQGQGIEITKEMIDATDADRDVWALNDDGSLTIQITEAGEGSVYTYTCVITNTIQIGDISESTTSGKYIFLVD